MGEARSDPSGIDLRPDGADGREPQIDTATYVAAKTFGAISLRLPFERAASIEEQATFAQRLPGAAEWTIGDPNGGPLSQMSAEEKRKDDEERELDAWRDVLEATEAAFEEQRRVWAQTLSTVGGVTLKGEEWQALAYRLHTDQRFRAEITAAFQARGLTEAEAETRLDRVADIAHIQSKPPSQRTEEEAARIKAADSDPSFKADMRDIRNFQQSEEPSHALTSAYNSAATGTEKSSPVESAAPPIQRLQTTASPNFGL